MKKNMIKTVLLVAVLLMTMPAKVPDADALPPAPHTGCFSVSADAYDDSYLSWYETQCDGLPEGPSLRSCRTTGRMLASTMASIAYEGCMGNGVGGCSNTNPWC